jgi:drug/metabolite transporter (DMT)-like permease
VLQLTVCGIVSLTFGFFIYGPPSIQNLVAAWPEILLMGIISKALAYLLNSIAQQHIPASTAAVIVTSEAVFGAVFAAILLGERLSLLRGIGAALVIAGVLAISLQPSLRLGRRKSSERSLNNKFVTHQPPRTLRPGE